MDFLILKVFNTTIEMFEKHYFGTGRASCELKYLFDLLIKSDSIRIHQYKFMKARCNINFSSCVDRYYFKIWVRPPLSVTRRKRLSSVSAKKDTAPLELSTPTSSKSTKIRKDLNNTIQKCTMIS